MRPALQETASLPSAATPYRRVALKLLKAELAAVLGAERFVQEIKTTAALQHPPIFTPDEGPTSLVPSRYP